MEPFAPSLLDEAGAGGGDEEVDDTEEHRGDTPFQSGSGAEPVEENVGGHPAAQEDAGVDAGVPEPVQEHDVGLTFARRTIAVWLVLSG
ncbi:hypothetical protein GCM10010489_38250 [Microbacterium saperdae]|nr:hypothetical protein GCM10010489_38250 [Microbacterium saperdae]